MTTNSKNLREYADSARRVTYVRLSSGNIYALQGQSVHWVTPAEWAKLNPKPTYKQI